MKLLFLADGSVDFCHRLEIRDQNIYFMVEIMKKLTRDIRNCNFQKKIEGEAILNLSLSEPQEPIVSGKIHPPCFYFFK